VQVSARFGDYMIFLVDKIIKDCSTFFPDPSSFYYGTKIYTGSSMCGFHVTYRPICFRQTDSIMLHCLESDEPGSGGWKRFWAEIINRRRDITPLFQYVIIDCIMNDRFESHIAKTWELVRPGEMQDPSTDISTYHYDLRAAR
jgi:hypothetical protein